MSLPLPAARAQDGVPSRQKLREQLLPVYESLRTDVRYITLTRQLRGNLHRAEVVDRYLEFLPLSPLELLEIKMRQERYEHIIPSFLAAWHIRWIELHQAEARKMYGDSYVEERLSRLRARKEVPSEEGPAPAKGGVAGPNRNVAATFGIPPEDYQGEIQIAVNPNDPNELVAAANTWDNMGGDCGDLGLQAAFYSSDGGTTWGYSCPPDDDAYELSESCSDLQGYTFGSDPAVTWNDQGEVFLEHMLLCYVHPGDIRFSVVVAQSSDGGASWGAQGVVTDGWHTPNLLEDKNFYAIDRHPGSPYFGRHYTCWDRQNNEKVAWSADDGQTWNEVDLPTSPSTGLGAAYDLGCEMAVEDDGTLHVVFDTLRCTSMPLSCNNEQMFYSRSTDGALTWSTPKLVRDFNLVSFSGNDCLSAQDERCIGPFGAIDVDNSGGSCDGTLYATYTDFLPNNPEAEFSDVWVSRSVDGGASWGLPVRVNDDATVRAQFHPFLAVDPGSGDVVVAWHDGRNGSPSDIDFFVARSTDCGATFEANIQASKPSAEFNNATISHSNMSSTANAQSNPNQYGEYLGLDVLGNKAYVAWADTRHYYPNNPGESQKDNLGFAVVEFSNLEELFINWELHPWPYIYIYDGCPGPLMLPEGTDEVSVQVALSGQEVELSFEIETEPEYGEAELNDNVLTYYSDRLVPDEIVLTVSDGRTSNQAVVGIEYDVEGSGGAGGGAVGTCVEVGVR